MIVVNLLYIAEIFKQVSTIVITVMVDTVTRGMPALITMPSTSTCLVLQCSNLIDGSLSRSISAFYTLDVPCMS